MKTDAGLHACIDRLPWPAWLRLTMIAGMKRRLIKLWLLSLLSWMVFHVIKGNLSSNLFMETPHKVVLDTEHDTVRSVSSTVLPSLPKSPFASEKGPSEKGPLEKSSAEKGPPDDARPVHPGNITEYCKSRPTDSKLHRRQSKDLGGLFFADKKRHLLFALNFKVGASTLIRAIPNSSGLVPPNEDMERLDLRSPKKLKKYGLRVVNVKGPSAQKVYSKYFKFMFVRNPYHRLLSGFRDKFRIHTASELPDKWFTETVQMIVSNYRTVDAQALAPNLTETAVTFEEFIKFVIDDNMNAKKTNEHWKPLYMLGMPCIINYDFIGKMENFPKDFSYLMSRIAVVPVPLAKFHSSPGAPTMTVFRKYWRQIPKDLVQQIQLIFQKDFEMFNYNINLDDYL